MTIGEKNFGDDATAVSVENEQCRIIEKWKIERWLKCDIGMLGE